MFLLGLQSYSRWILESKAENRKIWNDPQKNIKKNASGKNLHLLKTNKTTGDQLGTYYFDANPQP